MLDPKTIKLIGFDLDQTLYKETKLTFKIYRETVYRLAAQELGLELEVAKKQFKKHYQILKSGREALEKMGIKNAEKLSLKISQEADLSLAIKKDQKLIHLLGYLSKKYTLFLVTSSAKKSAFAKIKALGIDPKIFRYKIFGDNFLGGKFSGDSFRGLLKLTKRKPEEHLFIGDKETIDILPPKKLGMRTALAWGVSVAADFSLPTIYDLKNKL
jgi:FMN phosphatase YigB (HAD superfamily)